MLQNTYNMEIINKKGEVFKIGDTVKRLTSNFFFNSNKGIMYRQDAILKIKVILEFDNEMIISEQGNIHDINNLTHV